MFSDIVCQEEVCSEELVLNKAVWWELAHTMQGKEQFCFESVWGGTMYDPNNLPFDGNVAGIPNTFTLSVPRWTNAVPMDHCWGCAPQLRPYPAKRCKRDIMPTLTKSGYTPEDVKEVSTG